MIKILNKDNVCFLTFNRPEVLNAISYEMLRELLRSLKQAENDTSINVVVLTGEGDKAFVAGADIKEFLDLKNAEEAEQYSKSGQEVFNYIESMTKPVIAAVNGYALGGGLELALACDFRIASEKAKLGMPEIKLGLFPGYGGAQRLPRLVGKGRAMFLMMTGEMISAVQAEQWGVVEAVFPAESFRENVEKIANNISEYPPNSLSSLKRSVVYGMEERLEKALVLDSIAVGKLMVSKEAVTRAASFLERKPD